MLTVAGNVMPMAEDIVDATLVGEGMTSSPLGDDTSHVNVIMTDRGDIIATGTISRIGVATTLPGIIDVTPTASMVPLDSENATAPTASTTTARYVRHTGTNRTHTRD